MVSLRRLDETIQEKSKTLTAKNAENLREVRRERQVRKLLHRDAWQYCFVAMNVRGGELDRDHDGR